MEMDILCGKVPLATRVSRGVEQVVAERLTRDAEAVVTDCSRDREAVEQIMDIIRVASGLAGVWQVAPSRLAALRRLTATVKACVGRLDVRVASAGDCVVKRFVGICGEGSNRLPVVHLLRTASAGLVAIMLGTAVPAAADVTRADIDAWLWQTDLTTPPPSGLIVTRDRLDRVRGFVPPGYLEEFDGEGIAVEVLGSRSYPAHSSYRNMSVPADAVARLATDGSVTGHVAGQPFTASQIETSSPAAAGLMVGWNHAFRWQYFGRRSDEQTLSYLAAPVAGTASNIPVVTRHLTLRYQRVYLERLAWMPATDYRVEVEGTDDLLYKEYVEFLDPFNVSGTKFVVERSLDPTTDDQVYTYSPTERRVRRLSASERADSFMGTEFTMDDFDGFSGRVLDYAWTWLGYRSILDIIATGDEQIRFGGAHGRAPLGAWQMRDCHVVELVSTWSGHPFSSRILLVDAETFDVAIALAFDHDGRLVRVFDPVYRMPDPDAHTPEHSVPLFRAQVSINHTRDTATLGVVHSATVHPVLDVRQIEHMFDVSSLNAGR